MIHNTVRGTSNIEPEFTLLGGRLQLPVEFARPRVKDSRLGSLLHVCPHYRNTNI